MYHRYLTRLTPKGHGPNYGRLDRPPKLPSKGRGCAKRKEMNAPLDTLQRAPHAGPAQHPLGVPLGVNGLVASLLSLPSVQLNGSCHAA